MCGVIDDSRWDYILTLIQADLARFKEDLAPLETGDLHVAERLADGPWVDVTHGMVASHKRSITTFESLLIAFKDKRPSKFLRL